MDREKFTAEIEYPEKNLFVWAVLLNRVDMAKIFWQLGEVIFKFKVLEFSHKTICLAPNYNCIICV